MRRGKLVMTKERMAQIAKARYLIVYKGFSQKETAEIIGVSEKTMSSWSKKYEWNRAQEKEAARKGGMKAIMEDFFVFLRNLNGPMSKEVKKQWERFIQSIEDG